MKVKNLKEDNWGRLKIVQDVSFLNCTLCWFSIFFSFIVSSEKEGLPLGSSSQHSFIILYLLQHKNYAWYVEQQFFRSIPVKLLHLVSFWKREFLDLGSGLLEQKEFQKSIVVILIEIFNNRLQLTLSPTF